MTIAAQPHVDQDLLRRICDRAFAQMVAMIWHANHRQDKHPGDPKVGGHPAACASSCHILGALHLAVREVEDYVCCKPHASPMDHAYHHLMRTFGREDGTWLDDATAKRAMHGLRMFPEDEDFTTVFQSYHARTDPDSFHFLPSGSVGIPPVASVYLALAHRYMRDHGREVPEAHFWSLIGDSEFREGSLLEAMPDAAERQLGNVTWIVDYNRQNLDGTRMPNERGLESRDCDRIENTAVANGWKVIQVRHGAFREKVFKRKGGKALRQLFEEVLTDYEYQLALYKRDPELMRALVKQHSREAFDGLSKLSDPEVVQLFEDVGGHDLAQLVEALRRAKSEPTEPYLVVAHTVKGWNLECFADPSNHSTLPEKDEVECLLKDRGLSSTTPSSTSRRLGGGALSGGARRALPRGHRARAARAQAAPQGGHDRGGGRRRAARLARHRPFDVPPGPHPMDVGPAGGQDRPHQLRGRGPAGPRAHPREAADGGGGALGAGHQVRDDHVARRRHQHEHRSGARQAHLRAGPDHGDEPEDFDARHPDLMTAPAPWTRHIRFEIAEANCMSAAGSFGRMAHYTGHPCFPIMTVYDFFIKRALDQLFYNLYWGQSSSSSARRAASRSPRRARSTRGSRTSRSRT
jgi:pyruvate dehydrogenase E1 component